MTAVVAAAVFPDGADLDVARSVLATEAARLAGPRRRAGRRVCPRRGLARCGYRPRCGVGHGQVRPCGRKIAATLASTGTPALFVHPAEASHGDLGMIIAGDAVLALSNSGETAELADLVEHARRFALPLVAITARAD